MRYVSNLPHATKAEEHVAITMSDGIQLSARIWRPTDSDRTPVPHGCLSTSLTGSAT